MEEDDQEFEDLIDENEILREQIEQARAVIRGLQTENSALKQRLAEFSGKEPGSPQTPHQPPNPQSSDSLPADALPGETARQYARRTGARPANTQYKDSYTNPMASPPAPSKASGPMLKCQFCGKLIPEGEMEAHIAQYVGDIDQIHDAVKSGNIELLDNMINHGAELTMELIHTATMSKNLNILNYLISRGFDVNGQNKFGETPLHVACKTKGSMDLVQFLIAKGADPNVSNNLGDTPLQVAQNCGNHEVLLCFNTEDLNMRPSSRYGYQEPQNQGYYEARPSTRGRNADR